MIIDFHTHVFPPEVVKERASFARRDAAFGLLYGDPKARMATAEELREAMAAAGVAKAVVFGFPWTDPGILRMSHDYLLEAQERAPEQLTAFCTPSLVEGRSSVRDVENGLERGFTGIGEVAFYTSRMGRKSWSYLGSLAGLARERSAPLVLHANEPVGHAYPGKMDIRLRDLARFVEEQQGIPLILAHWGGGLFFYELMKSVRRFTGSLYYDTAASPYLYAPQVYRIAVDIIGPDRILFGTDYPLIAPSRYLREIAESGVAAGDRSRILGENAARLLKM
ncbi:MAG: amidohydrolase family protein [bacterium]